MVPISPSQDEAWPMTLLQLYHIESPGLDYPGQGQLPKVAEIFI